MESEPAIGARPRDGRRRRLPLLRAALVVMTALVMLPTLTSCGEPSLPMPTLRPSEPVKQVRSLSIDFGIVTDPATDWTAVNARLNQVDATSVNLNAGRVEFTAFDWPEHPEAAAESGTDHLAVAARALNTRADGQPREVSLIVDAYVPAWIEKDPSIAGVDPEGKRSTYTASASQLVNGEVGQRLTDYVTTLGERYNPKSVEITELFLDDYTYGADDLALYRSMTGAKDWPRDRNGDIDTEAAEIGTWRSEVLATLMKRLRTALDQTRGGQGRQIGLVLDVRVNWEDPAAGRPLSGHDYRILHRSGTQLQLWVYIGRADRRATEVEQLTKRLAEGGYDMSMFIISVGLWRGSISGDELGTITPAELTQVVRGASTNGITNVNVTPYSLMTPEHWTALAEVWA